MNRFTIALPRTYGQASALLADRRFSLPMLKAGGMDVVDHLKEGLIEPDLIIDVKPLRHNDLSQRIVQVSGANRLRIEAGTTLADIAASELIRSRAPVVAQAAGDAATPQVRNVATAAGNLLQRPRCWYYRNADFNCLKKGGGTCFAVEGENKYHAIFGDGPCHIVHPSNLALALYVCAGVAHVMGGEREVIPIRTLYHLPSAGVRDEHTLKPTEVIRHVTIDPAPNSGFVAIKEKQSFDWPLVMAAVSLQLDGNRIALARVCAGAVAPIPWGLPKVERALKGVAIDDDDALREACAIAVAGARPMSGNAYKITLLPVVVRRAVLRAAGREVTS